MKKLLPLSILLITSCSNEAPQPVLEENRVVLDYSITEQDQIHWVDVFSQEEERYL